MNTFLARTITLFATSKKNRRYALLTLFLCVSVVIYFEASNRYILPTEDMAFFDQSADIEQVYKTIQWPAHQKNTIRVIYFWQAYCPCDATVISHFKALYKEHADNNIEFYLADLSLLSSQNTVYEPPFDNVLDQEISDAFKPFVSHTPSVAIWNQNNELTYYGPHNLGFVCNADTSFVKKVIDSLLQNMYSKNTNIVGESCFCKL